MSYFTTPFWSLWCCCSSATPVYISSCFFSPCYICFGTVICEEFSLSHHFLKRNVRTYSTCLVLATLFSLLPTPPPLTSRLWSTTLWTSLSSSQCFSSAEEISLFSAVKLRALGSQGNGCFIRWSAKHPLPTTVCASCRHVRQLTGYRNGMLAIATASFHTNIPHCQLPSEGVEIEIVVRQFHMCRLCTISLAHFFLQQNSSDNEIFFWNKKKYIWKSGVRKGAFTLSTYYCGCFFVVFFFPKEKEKENGKVTRKNKTEEKPLLYFKASKN